LSPVSPPLAVFLVHLVASAVLFGLARLVPERRTRLLHGIASLALAGILLKAGLASLPSLEMRFDGSDAFVFLERDLVVPFGVLFFAAASRIVPEPRNKRATALMPLVLLAFLVVVNRWTFGQPECYRKDWGRWRGGVCLQATGFTCGAASIATICSARGVRVTEHEAAEASFTIPDRGITDLGATRALRRLLPGRKVTIRPVAVSELASVPLPCLAPTRYSFWFDHMVTVLAVRPDGVLIGDPLQGPTLWTREEVEAKWRGHVITAE
jgi:hypothetical protein